MVSCFLPKLPWEMVFRRSNRGPLGLYRLMQLRRLGQSFQYIRDEGVCS